MTNPTDQQALVGDWGDSIAARAEKKFARPLHTAAVLHGMADHTLNMYIVNAVIRDAKYATKGTPADQATVASLVNYFADVAKQVREFSAAEPDAVGQYVDWMDADHEGHPATYWHARRILSAQDVKFGSVAMNREPDPGAGRAIVRPLTVAAVLDCLAERDVCEHLVNTIVNGSALCPPDDRHAEYWPEATSLGRWFHRVADYIEWVDISATLNTHKETS